MYAPAELGCQRYLDSLIGLDRHFSSVRAS